MNRKTVIRLIIALLLIVAGSYFYAYVKRDAALYDTSYTRSAMIPSARIYSGHDFLYEFDCGDDNMTGIKLILSDSGKDTGVIEYSLVECGKEGEVSSGSLKLSRFKSGKFTLLKTDTVKESSGKRYKLVISCGNSEAEAAAVWVLPDGSDTPAVCYSYRVWDLQTMIISVFLGAYLVIFVMVLVKIFRK